jgi:hypothetical protein|tara:strand:+ start:2572 stop:2733 length:162 start_codon:yes stop_codon:yes gene_type:complete
MINLSINDKIILGIITIIVIIGAWDLYSKNINIIEPLENIDHIETPEEYERLV